MTLFNGNPIDWTAYNEGKAACIETEERKINIKNPYTFGTDQFYSWNKGWNEVYNYEL